MIRSIVINNYSRNLQNCSTRFAEMADEHQPDNPDASQQTNSTIHCGQYPAEQAIRVRRIQPAHNHDHAALGFHPGE